MGVFVIQLVVGGPPFTLCPGVEISTSGKTFKFSSDTKTSTGRPSLVSDGEYWLVFTDGVEIDERNPEVILTLCAGEKKQHTVVLQKIQLGITRVVIDPVKDKNRRNAQSISNPVNSFIDIVAEERNSINISFSGTDLSAALDILAHENTKNIQKQPTQPTQPVQRKIPGPPLFGLKQKIKEVNGKTKESKISVFPPVKWNVSLVVRGSLFDSVTEWKDKRERWREVEREFVQRFCIPQKETEPLVPLPLEKKKACAKPIMGIISGRQEFLASIILTALERKGVHINEIGKEVSDWVNGRGTLIHPDEISGIAGILPGEKESNCITSANINDLTLTEKRIRDLLSSKCAREDFILARYSLWALPAIKKVKDTLNEYLHGITEICRDRSLPLLLQVCLRLGNAVNVRYCNSLNGKNEAGGFSIASLDAFTRCIAPGTEDRCSCSLLEFIMTMMRTEINLQEMHKKYLFLRRIRLCEVQESIEQIKMGIEEVASTARKSSIRVNELEKEIEKVSAIMSQIHEKIALAARKYGETQNTFIPSMLQAIEALDKVHHLFL